MRMRLPIMCLRRPHLSSYLQISHCEASRTSLPQLHVPNIVLSISPAVYVAYTGLEAIQACDPLFDPFPTGSVYQTTIGDPPEALSTFIGEPGGNSSTFSYPEPTTLFRTFNYTEFQQFWEDPAQHPSERGRPYLSVPQELTQIDPTWKSCVPAWYGSWDPPRALTAVAAMVPSPTSAVDPSSIAGPAAPGSGIASAHIPASSTTLPSAQATKSSLPFLPVRPIDPPVVASIESDTQPPLNTEQSWTKSSID